MKFIFSSCFLKYTNTQSTIIYAIWVDITDEFKNNATH